jgi:hypothetical protein
MEFWRSTAGDFDSFMHWNVRAESNPKRNAHFVATIFFTSKLIGRIPLDAQGLPEIARRSCDEQFLLDARRNAVVGAKLPLQKERTPHI